MYKHGYVQNGEQITELEKQYLTISYNFSFIKNIYLKKKIQ